MAPEVTSQLPPITEENTNEIVNEQPTHLLRLPAEIRNEILFLILVDSDEGETISINSHPLTPIPRPSIVNTCQQLRQEALPIHLANHTFRLYLHDFQAKQAFRWLDGLAPRYIQHIKALEIVSPRITAYPPVAPPTTRKLRSRKRPQPPYHYVLDDWDRILTHIKSIGLTAPQLYWLGIHANGYYPEHPQLSQRMDEVIWDAFALLPMLKRHDLFAPNQAKLDVLSGCRRSEMWSHDWRSDLSRAVEAAEARTWYANWADVQAHPVVEERDEGALRESLRGSLRKGAGILVGSWRGGK